MSFFDDLKGKAEDLAGEHGDQLEGGLDKLAELVDDKTGHEHRDQIDTGVDKAKELLEGLEQAHRDGDHA